MKNRVNASQLGNRGGVNAALRHLGIPFIALLLCSCATTRQPTAIVPASELPAEVTMNEDAGRGNLLFVTIRLESGEELPLAVDTGSSWTVLDKSFEPKLGKRLGAITTRSSAEKRSFAVLRRPGFIWERLGS